MGFLELHSIWGGENKAELDRTRFRESKNPPALPLSTWGGGKRSTGEGEEEVRGEEEEEKCDRAERAACGRSDSCVRG